MMNKAIYQPQGYQPQGNMYLKPTPPKGGSSQQEDGQNNKWIRVDERLPENGEDVLVFIERNAWDEDGFRFRKKCIDIGWQVNGKWHCDECSGVVGIAWMPLPEPYKGGENDDLS